MKLGDFQRLLKSPYLHEGVLYRRQQEGNDSWSVDIDTPDYRDYSYWMEVTNQSGGMRFVRAVAMMTHCPSKF